MRKDFVNLLIQARARLVALALIALAVMQVQPAEAVTLDAALTAGTWSTISTRHNDEYSIVKATKLTTTVTSATLDIPGNTLSNPKLFAQAIVADAGGVSLSTVQTQLAATFSVDASATVLTDVVSQTTALGSTLGGVNLANALISSTLDTSTRWLKVIGTNIATNEIVELQVEYRIPVKYRWYRAF